MIDFLPLHDKIHDILASWVRKYHTSIQEFGGHLLFSNKHYSRRQAPDYLTKNYMRKVFRGYLKKAGLDTVYATLKTDGNQPGEKRRLYRLSTHSLRHYFITRIYKTSLNPVVTQALARHRAFGTTQNYINLTKKDCQQAMEKAFTTTQEEPKRGGLESPKIQEFLMFYEAWKGHISKG
jgi:integrase